MSETKNLQVTQPHIPGGDPLVSTKKVLKNLSKSQEILEYLEFDPIVELVSKYKELEALCNWHERWRIGEIQPISANGRARNYSPTAHAEIYDRLLKVSEQLLRYKYGRIPETLEIQHKEIPPFVVNLSREGDTYSLNEKGEASDDYI